MNNLPLLDEAFVNRLVGCAREASKAIMTIYRDKDNYDLQLKTDQSPLTAADLAANTVICEFLAQTLPLPIISEENEAPTTIERQEWESYWLVDPLDGTKEFIAGNGEFTVNIALIHQGRPVLGIVHVPVTDVTYSGVLDARTGSFDGAYKFSGNNGPTLIRVRNVNDRSNQRLAFTILLSHRHASSDIKILLANVAQHWPGEIEIINRGSSLKFCVIAEGLADFYPRLADTSEWDTAAAQAVLEAAGGRVVKAPPIGASELLPLLYNDKKDFLNPHFYALGDAQFNWTKILGMSRR